MSGFQPHAGRYADEVGASETCEGLTFLKESQTSPR